MRWLWFALAAFAVLLLGLVGCAAARLPAVPLDPAQAPADPPALLGAFLDDAPVTTREEWQTRRAPLLRQALTDAVFGPFPQHAPARVLSRDVITYPPLPDAVIEQWSVAVGSAERPLHFNMMLALPRRDGPVPVVVMQNFCGNRAAFPDAPPQIARPLTPVYDGCEGGWRQSLIIAIFGRHILSPPYQDILGRGYGVALFYAGDVVGDTESSARAGLAQLYGDAAGSAGAIAAWAWLYTQSAEVLAADARIDAGRIAIWGHSRNAKSALWAAANDPRIAAVIAHQSGRGGASLNHSDSGESIGQMLDTYPWWYPPAYAAAADLEPALDQHQVLALIAPRPVLIGSSRRDAWADPQSAWTAARAASPAYELFGGQGLAQDQMREPNLQAGLAFYTRGGLHGVHTQDWRVFLDFLDAHFQRD